MSDPALWCDEYEWSGGREAMLRVGAKDAPVVVIAPALFEEANRTRAFTLAIMRALATHGLSSALPDLPGQGDSLLPTERATLADWRTAFAVAVERVAPVASVVAIRGGALVDALASTPARWHLAPLDGPTMAREMSRLGGLSGGDGLIAGNRVGPTLLADLAQAVPTDGMARTVRLEADPRPADRVVQGRPLWRAVEPDNDIPLASLLADDISAWTKPCAAF